MPSAEDSEAAESGRCSKAHQSLLTFPPSTWCAEVAAPHRNPGGKSVEVVVSDGAEFMACGALSFGCGGPRPDVTGRGPASGHRNAAESVMRTCASSGVRALPV